MVIGERIRAEREAQNVSRAELARFAGIAPSTLSDLELGLSKGTTALHKIATRLRVRPEWLETGRGVRQALGEDLNLSARETGSAYLRIDQLDGEAGMGEGRVNEDYPEIVRSIDFDVSYIRALIGFVPQLGRLKLVTGHGNSMIPAIRPGDVVIVDTGCTSFDGDGIYLINTGHGQQIKGLQDRGDAVYVVSANTDIFPPFPAPDGTVIGGKVYLRNRLDRMN